MTSPESQSGDFAKKFDQIKKDLAESYVMLNTSSLDLASQKIMSIVPQPVQKPLSISGMIARHIHNNECLNKYLPTALSKVPLN